MSLYKPETGANELVLDRPEAEKHVADHLSPLVDVLEDLVDYGSNLIPRCWVSSRKQLLDVVLLPVLLKQCIGLLDASTVLTKHGAVDPCNLQLRALFEASVYIDWIIKRDSERRARAYYVANMRRGLRWAKRLIPGTPEYRALRAEMKSLKSSLPRTPRASLDAARADVARIETHLRERRFRQMNEAFERRRGRGLYDPAWYKVLFPKRRRASLRTLCRHVNRLPEYRVIYEITSETMHSARSDTHVRVEPGGKLHLKALRNLEGVGILTQHLLSETLHTYRAFLSHYRYDELSAFSRAYVDRWRRIYRTQYTVNYQYIERVIGG